MLHQLSANIDYVQNKTRVRSSGPTGSPEVVARGYDMAAGATWQDESMPWSCEAVRDDGVTVAVVGRLRTRRFSGGGRSWRDPHVFEQEQYVIPVRTSSDAKRVGLGMINQAIETFWRDLEKLDDTMFARAKGVPRPGRSGHTELHYARWVQKYLAAVETHGQRYMASLLESNPGYTASVIRRTINEAESSKFKLITDRPGQGKAGGRMTDKCARILDSNPQTNEGTDR